MSTSIVKRTSYSNASFAEILPAKLYLSAAEPAGNRALLQELGVTHILNLTGYKCGSQQARFPDKHGDLVQYLHFYISDEMDEEISAIFPRCFAFIDAALTVSGKVIVHCEAGISRSATIVIAYLIARRGMKLQQAYEHVLSAKPNIAPNQAFWDQLTGLEKQTFGLETSSLPTEEYLSRQVQQIVGSTISLPSIRTALRMMGYDVNQTICMLLGV